MHCPNCGTEVQPGATQCRQCEIPIAWDGDTATFQVPGEDVPVFVAKDPTMLPVIESLLEVNGIPFVVANGVTQDLIGWGQFNLGYNPITGPPIVKVHAQHAEAARELIASASTVPAEPDAEA
jgi:hypothetical protein